jgi:ribosomal protein S6
MVNYEITYVASPLLDETGRGELDSGIDAKVAELGGSITYQSPSLRRRLAYMIEKQTSAFIRTLQIELDPAKAADVHTLLKKHPSILRFSILHSGRREEVPMEIVERYSRKKDAKGASNAPAGRGPRKPQTAAPAKEVTMQDVEKGIEEALSAEVK